MLHVSAALTLSMLMQGSFSAVERLLWTARIQLDLTEFSFEGGDTSLQDLQAAEVSQVLN